MSVRRADQTSLLYPGSETDSSSDRQSHGSFKPVLIVLAVILVVSAVACVFGRLCNRRHNTSKRSKQGRRIREMDMKPEPDHDAFQANDRDIEIGFDKRFSSAKVAADNDQPSMNPPNRFHEPNNLGMNMSPPNRFREANNLGLNMSPPNRFREPNSLGLNMSPPNRFREPNNMGVNLGRPNVSFEPNNSRRLDSVRGTPMGRPESFEEASIRSPNLFGKAGRRDVHIRFGSNEEHEIEIQS